MRKPRSFDSIEDALEATAIAYRRNLWRDAADYVEVWTEKDAVSGVVYPVTSLYDVPLMVARGFTSETFAFEAVQLRGDDRRPFCVYYLGDFDRSGVDAAKSLEKKLRRFAGEKGIPVSFTNLAVTEEQVTALSLPTRQPKRKSAANRNWPHDFAVEFDAIPPDLLRDLVEAAINEHLPQDTLWTLKQAEESERELLRAWVEAAA